MAAPMELRWNTFKHEFPSNAVFTVWKQKSKLPNCTSTKTELVKMFTEACMFLEPVFMTYLSAESCTLRRLLYKLKNQQKLWKRFSLLEKIQKCLTRASEINLHEQFKIMLSFCEIKKDLGDMETVPSGTSTKFLLEKVVGLSKLCSCIMQLSQQTFILIVGNLQIGEFVVQNLMFMAIISRIWILVRGVLTKLFSWYDLLRKFSVQDQKSKYYMMFKQLPECLSKWIDRDIASLKVTRKKISKKSKQDILGKMFGSLQNSSEGSLHSEMEQDLNNKDELYSAMEACSEMDIGEPVVIPDDENVIPKKKKKKKKKLSLCEDTDGFVEINNTRAENEFALAPVQETNKDVSLNEELMLIDDTGVAIPRKKKKKRKHKVENYSDIGDELCDNISKDNVKKEKTILYKACESVEGDEDNIAEDIVQDVQMKQKKKKKKKLLFDDVNTKDDECIPEDTVQDVQMKQKKKKKLLFDDVNTKDDECIPEDTVQDVQMKQKKKKKLLFDDVNTKDDECIPEDTAEDIVQDVQMKQKIKKKKKLLFDDVNTKDDECIPEDTAEDIVQDVQMKQKKKKKKKLLFDDVNTKDDECIPEDRVEDVAKKMKYVEDEESVSEDKVDSVVKKKKMKSLYDNIDNKTKEEESIAEDGMDSVVAKKRKKKKKTRLCEDFVELKEENRTEDTMDEMNRINNSYEKEGERTCKKAKRKKDKLVGKDLVTSEMEFDHLVDPSLQYDNSNTDVIRKIKKKKMKKVLEQETLSMIEKKHKKRRHKHGNETTMEICDAPKIAKRRKLQSDNEELDDIFSCLE